jgi:tetratricopeptide (TPR) repeat protein
MGAGIISARDGYSFGPFSVDVRQSRILDRGKPVPWWSKRRFELLKILLEADGDVVRYDDLVEKVWGGKDVTFHTINKTANDLKRCLGMFGDCVQNKHSVGFYFLRPATAPSRSLDFADSLDLNARAQYGVAVEEWNRRSEQSLQRALGHFRQVSYRYPQFVPALLGAADCLMLLAHAGFPVLRRRDVLPEAKQNIERAILLTENKALAAEAYAAMGKLQLIHEWDWQSAESNLKTALSLDPDHAAAHHILAQVFVITNRPEQSLAAIDRARQLSPTSAIIHSTSGWLRYFLGTYEEAIPICRDAVELHPAFPAGYAILALAYQGAGLLQEARDAFETSLSLYPSPNAVAGLGYLNGISGRTTHARAAFRRLMALAKNAAVVSPFFPALVHLGLGQVDQTFHHLTSAANQRFDWLLHLGIEPRWQSLHGDRRFKALLKRVGLEEFWRRA